MTWLRSKIVQSIMNVVTNSDTAQLKIKCNHVHCKNSTQKVTYQYQLQFSSNILLFSLYHCHIYIYYVMKIDQMLKY